MIIEVGHEECELSRVKVKVFNIHCTIVHCALTPGELVNMIYFDVFSKKSREK